MTTWSGWQKTKSSNHPLTRHPERSNAESKDPGTFDLVKCMCFVYVLTNWNDSVLYIGVTSNLPKRLYEHKNGLVDGFTKKYNVHKLVYYEETTYMQSAIAREKQLKKWSRAKKNALVEQMNPTWRDLSLEWG